MLSPPKSDLGKVLEKYVRVRVTSLEGVDIGHWEYDFHNSLIYFMTNADEHIYARYGGRDSRAAESYLDLNSLRLALEEGLKQHELYKEGKLPQRSRSKPVLPRDIPRIADLVIDKRGCVECHHIADYRAQALEESGELDKVRTMFPFPDIRKVGIELDVPKGLVVKGAQGPALAAGMKPGDRIRSIEGKPVITFGDLQFEYDKVPRTAARITLGVERGGQTISLKLELPPLWWEYDIEWRFWSIDPVLYFESTPLTADEKKAERLSKESFAARVDEVDPVASMLGVHDLKAGDIIVSVDGAKSDAHIPDARLYLRMKVTPGTSADLEVLRDDKRIPMTIKTTRQYYRKVNPETLDEEG